MIKQTRGCSISFFGERILIEIRLLPYFSRTRAYKIASRNSIIFWNCNWTVFETGSHTWLWIVNRIPDTGVVCFLLKYDIVNDIAYIDM